MCSALFSGEFACEIHLAFLGDKVIGFVIFQKEYSFFPAKPVLLLMHLSVSEPYRGHGVGQMLFEFCKKRAKELSCEAMEWLVLDWNKRAMKFYEDNGAKKDVAAIFFELDSL
jgi:GNAT superfamily N-acetyltransferase